MASESLEKFKKNRKAPLLSWTLIIAFVVAAVFVLIKAYELERPSFDLRTDVSLMGSKGKVEFVITDEKSGIQEVTVILRQGKNEVTLSRKKFSRQGLFGGGPSNLELVADIDAPAMGFADGRADLFIQARDFSFWQWMKGNESSASYPVVFDTKPPVFRLVDSPRSIKPGSSGIVVYRANEEVSGHGVTIDGAFHPGFPVPVRGDGVFAAVIGIPYDTRSVKSVFLSGQDRAGNLGRMTFSMEIRKIRKKSDQINISDAFLNKKIPEFAQYYPNLPGKNFVEKYIYVNNTIRTMNAEKIKEICANTIPERMWEGRFRRMRRSSRRAGYAEYRTYLYKGKKIDSQVHLGIDLASVRRAPVEAANGGKVIFADYLGIYGNMVVIDHGQGVFSLYSHMSDIKAEVGDLVEIGAVLGNTGTTGMAGGDHLHFSILINGVFVNPLEWWDKGWLKLNIMQYLKG